MSRKVGLCFAQQEIVDQHFRAFVICFSVTFFFVAFATFGLQIWVVLAYTQADPRPCNVPIRTWVQVLLGLWALRLCRSCIDRCAPGGWWGVASS